MKTKSDKLLKFKILIIVFLPILFQYCKKSNEEKNDGSLNYEIEIDKDYRILKITAYDSLLTTYVYTDKMVEKISSWNGTEQSTEKFFLNKSGLADSSVFNDILALPTVTYYKYNPENYLIHITINNTTFNYQDGNCISAIDGTYGGIFNVGVYYEYGPLLNYVNIENFTGSYIGKLNKNLVIKASYRGLHGGDSRTTNFSYVLNSDGLVVQRTATSPNGNDPDTKEISNFKYKYVMK